MSNGLLLDTVVVSELRKGSKADRAVIQWQDSVGHVPTYLSVITLLEIRLGVHRIASRDPDFAARLDRWYHERLVPRFHDHLFPVDRAIAEAAAELSATRSRPTHDVLLAATALVHGLTLATRNVSDFAETGIAIVNPWDSL